MRRCSPAPRADEQPCRAWDPSLLTGLRGGDIKVGRTPAMERTGALCSDQHLPHVLPVVGPQRQPWHVATASSQKREEQLESFPAGDGTRLTDARWNLPPSQPGGSSTGQRPSESKSRAVQASRWSPGFRRGSICRVEPLPSVEVRGGKRGGPGRQAWSAGQPSLAGGSGRSGRHNLAETSGVAGH